MKFRITGLLLAVLCLTACGTKVKKHVDPVRVEMETISDSKQFFNKNYVGEVEAETTTAVSFNGSGTVSRVLVSSGQHVSKGQLLAVMDPTQCKNAVMSAEAMMMQAQDAHDRMKVLHDRKSLSDMDWVEVQSKCAQAKSNLQIARKMLSDCNLTAPCAGVIGKKMLESGQVALPSQPVCTILNINRVKISVHIPEKEIGHITENSTSMISVAALNRTFKGGKIEKEVEADAITRSYVVKINVDNNDSQLLPGMVCDVNMSLSSLSQHENVLCVPITAVQRSASGDKFLWKAKDGKACRAKVTLGEAHGNLIAVESGLADGDKIIVKGYQKLSEGSSVIESPKK